MNIILDEGYSFGLGVFETIHVKNGRALFVSEHLKRLNDGLKALNIDKFLEKEFVNEEIKKISFKNEDEVLKITVSEKNVVFSTRKYIYTGNHYKKGYKIKISEVKRNEKSLFSYIKSLNYAENIYEKRKYEKDYDEVLFLNFDKKVCECATSNIFYIKNGKIFTPKTESGLLNGIIRQYILNEYEVEEKFVNIEDLLSADEVFLTNSLMAVMPVVKIEEKIFKAGEITKKIFLDYQDKIKRI